MNLYSKGIYSVDLYTTIWVVQQWPHIRQAGNPVGAQSTRLGVLATQPADETLEDSCRAAGLQSIWKPESGINIRVETQQ